MLPTDLDLNFHLNNGRFLSFMDIGRTRLSVRTGLFGKAKRLGWGYGVVGGLNITYLRSLVPFQRFSLKTRLAGHYDNWLFIEQRIEYGSYLVSAALVKVAFLSNRKRVEAKDIMEALGVLRLGENEVYLEHLLNSEKEFLKHIK